MKKEYYVSDYINKIDINRLTRDYNKSPVNKNGRSFELIPLEDFKYLYIELNLRKKEIALYLNTTEDYINKLAKLYNIKKSYDKIIENLRNTTKEKHGVDNPSKSEYFIQLKNQHNLAKYGVENVFQLKEIKEKSEQTCIKKYGKKSFRQTKEYDEKCNKTCLEKYGTEWCFQSEEIKEKIKKTNLERHGVENYVNPEKAKQTKLERYGDANAGGFGSNEFKKAMLNKYGVENIFSLKEVQKKINSKKHIKYDNKTFDSKVELVIYKLLKEKFRLVEVQYTTEKYPFNCDFYIPEKDLYIEYQGYFGHGTESFDVNNMKHQQILNEWKERASRSKNNKFIRAIKIWTEIDPLKRTVANKNNLNWIEFFNMEQFMEWFNKQ